MFGKPNLSRILKKAIEKTANEFADSVPRISKHLYYGIVELGPENLVIWFLFKTDHELAEAKQNGLCKRIEETAISNLVGSGYPKDAFTEKVVDLPGKVSFINGTDEQKEKIIRMMTHRKAHIAFTSEEDIDKKAHGDYHLYFQ